MDKDTNFHDANTSEPSFGKASNTNLNLKCTVCGDGASGIHFNAMTCESCKVFFKRAIVGKKELMCFRKDNCEISLTSRKGCQKCRMKKCLEMGMKPEYVIRSLNVRKNQKKVKGVKQKPKSNTSNSGAGDRMENSEVSEVGLWRDSGVQWTHPTRPLSPEYIPHNIYAVQGRDDGGDQQDPEGSINAETEIVQWVPLDGDTGVVDWSPSAFHHCFNLRYTKLTELLVTGDVWEMLKQENMPHVHGWCCANLSVEDFHNLVIFTTLGVIRQFRRLNAIKTFSMTDQQTLLKASVKEMSILRLMCKTDPRTGLVNWEYPGQEHIAVDFALRTRGITDLEQLKSVNYSFPDKFRYNDVIVALMSVLLLFNPYDPLVENKQAVQTVQKFYRQLLKDHLMDKLELPKARQAYFYLLGRVEMVRMICSISGIDTELTLDPDTMEPIVIDMVGISPI